MFKNTIILVLTVLYLSATTGYYTTTHWCGKQIAAISINAKKVNGCSCSKKMAATCCKSYSHYYKINDRHHTSNKLQLLKAKQLQKLFPFVDRGLTDNYSFKNNKAFAFARLTPPLLLNGELYLAHRALLI